MIEDRQFRLSFQDQFSLNTGQKYCRMLQGDHSAILSTFIKLPLVFKIFVLSILSGRFTHASLLITGQIFVLDSAVVKTQNMFTCSSHGGFLVNVM